MRAWDLHGTNPCGVRLKADFPLSNRRQLDGPVSRKSCSEVMNAYSKMLQWPASVHTYAGHGAATTTCDKAKLVMTPARHTSHLCHSLNFTGTILVRF